MLGRKSRLFVFVALLCAAMSSALNAQQTPKVSLDTSETIFTVATAINACGYDQDLTESAPMRSSIRGEVAREIENSAEARSATQEMCSFYREHQQGDSSRDLAQYISLALNLGEPPVFAPTVKEADLPPDAAYVLGVVPILQRFYTATNIHGMWLRHAKDYDSLIERNHEAIAKLLLNADVYLKIPVSGYLGRRFVVYLEPMTAPGQANARNYGADYFMVVSPENGQLKMDQIRHTYLHFILDPMAMKRAKSINRLVPLLDSIKTAPLDESYKANIDLLVTESLIRAIEARMKPGKGKQADFEREQSANDAAKEGFILAPYFYEKLVAFEKDPAGLQDAYADWIYYVDIGRERRRASDIQFATKAAPDVVRASKPKTDSLDEAEKFFTTGHLDQAKQLAEQTKDSGQGDRARALFLLARISTQERDWESARNYFEETIKTSTEPRVTAWSHIYLGRIFDIKFARSEDKNDRDTAVQHYKAALSAGDPGTATKAAAERGLKQAYRPPKQEQEQGPETK